MFINIDNNFSFKRIPRDDLKYIDGIGHIDINDEDISRTDQIKILNIFGDCLYSVNLRDIDTLHISKDDLDFIKRELIEYFI